MRSHHMIANPPSEYDPLWPHFASLWRDLHAISPAIQLLGGYSLTLQLRNRLTDDSRAAFVPPSRWHHVEFRPPKDLDMIVSAESVGSKEIQARVHETLRLHSFQVVPGKKRWKYAKTLPDGFLINIDFLAAHPPQGDSRVRVSKGRLCPAAKTKGLGFHGRLGIESPISLNFASVFEVEALEVSCLSPLAFVAMKIEAMRKKWNMSLEVSRPVEKREIKRRLAIKHAMDIYMTLAMLSPIDRDNLPDSTAEIRRSPIYPSACESVERILTNQNSAMTPLALERWTAADLKELQQLLRACFS